MEKKTIPFLCGGTFFTQILRARKPRKSSAELTKGKKESLSEPEVFRRLISIYQLTDFFSPNSTLKSNTSHFKQCQKNLCSFIEFNDYDKQRDFATDIKEKDSKAFSAMVQFIHDFIDESRYEQLARNLFGLIQEDSSIPPDTEFFIWPGWIEKQNLIAQTEINLPDLLLGLLYFIATKRASENIKGADTYRSWYPVKKRYSGNVGLNINENLKVTCSELSHSETAAHTIDENTNQKSEKTHDASDSSNAEDNNFSKTQLIQNATIVNQYGKKNTLIQHANIVNIDDSDSNSSAPPTTMFGGLKISKNDAILLKKFKEDYKEILKYCMRTDPTAVKFKIEIISWIEYYYDKWKFDWRDFESEKIQKIVYHTLKNFNELLYYLSDKYMRVISSTPDYLFFRNESREEGERLRDEFHPNIDRIREELAARYHELWPVNESIFK